MGSVQRQNHFAASAGALMQPWLRGRRHTCNIGANEISLRRARRGDASIELWEAGRNTGLLERVLTRTIRIVKE